MMRLTGSRFVKSGLAQLAALVVLGGWAAAHAQEDPLAACARLDNRDARLACYDSVVRKRRPSGPATPPNPASPALQNPFASRLGNAPAAPAEPKLIVSDVRAISFDSEGKFTVTLANGQVWHQFDADSGNAVFKRHSRNFVKITHEFWKTYNLQINNQNAVYRVVRLK